MQIALRRAQQQEELRALEVAKKSKSVTNTTNIDVMGAHVSSPSSLKSLSSDCQVGRPRLPGLTRSPALSNYTEVSDGTMLTKSKNNSSSRFTAENDNIFNQDSNPNFIHQYKETEPSERNKHDSFHTTKASPFLINSLLATYPKVTTATTMEESATGKNAWIKNLNAQIYPRTGKHN